MRMRCWSSDLCSSDLDIVFAAQRPEQSGKRDVDAVQDRGQESDIAAEQPETAVDVCDERLHELIYDVEVIHARDSWKKWKDVAGTAGRARGKPSDPRDGNGARRGAGAQRRPTRPGAGCRACRPRGTGSYAPAPHARTAGPAPTRP